MLRTWVKGVAKLAKRYLLAVAAHNLRRILRKLFGIGKPEALQGEGDLGAFVYLLLVRQVASVNNACALAAEHTSQDCATRGIKTAAKKGSYFNGLRRKQTCILS
jgi:hypothetical protein